MSGDIGKTFTRIRHGQPFIADKRHSAGRGYIAFPEFPYIVGPDRVVGLELYGIFLICLCQGMNRVAVNCAHQKHSNIFGGFFIQIKINFIPTLYGGHFVF